MKTVALLFWLVLGLCCSRCTDRQSGEDQNEYISANLYAGVILLERKLRESETCDSAFSKELEKLSAEELESSASAEKLGRMMDSINKAVEEEEREESMVFADMELINIAVSPKAYLQAKDTTSIVLEYSYFLNEPEWHDEEHGEYIYITLPSPEKLMPGTSYTIPTEALTVSVWVWSAWKGLKKCKAITGNIVFSRFESDTVKANVRISGNYCNGYPDTDREFHFSKEIEFVKKGVMDKMEAEK